MTVSMIADNYQFHFATIDRSKYKRTSTFCRSGRDIARNSISPPSTVQSHLGGGHFTGTNVTNGKFQRKSTELNDPVYWSLSRACCRPFQSRSCNHEKS